jgi:cytochrome P450
LISGFEGAGGCEFIDAFARKLPSTIFLRMFGLPIDMLPQFLAWEHAFLSGADAAEQLSAVRAIYAYLKDQCDARRGRDGDDLLSVIVNGEAGGRPLSDAEAYGMAFLLYNAGLDTVTSSLGWHMRHLALHPEIQERLRADPSLIPAAVDELFRAYPVTNNNRTVAYDLDFHGVPMRQGDIVAMPMWFAGRDDRVYDNPQQVDIERRPRHLTFGTGVHYCLGIYLARLQLKVVLEAMLGRFRNIRLADGEKAEFSLSATWSVTRLPLIWD